MTVLLLPLAAAARPLDGAELRDRVLPLVEEVAGQPLGEPPEVKVVRTAALEDVLAQKAAAVLGALHPGVDRSVLGDLGVLAELFTPTIAGTYDATDHTVYLAADALRGAVADLRGRGFDVDRRALAECVVARELAHALQRATLPEVLATADREAIEAFAIVSEGHATWVQEQVCARLGHAELREPIRLLLGFEADVPSASAVGLRFVEAHADRIRAVVGAPPADTLMVWLPERYAPGPPPPPGPQAVLADAAATLLGTSRGATLRERIGYHTLVTEVGATDAAREALGALAAAHAASITDGRAIVTVRQLRFTSPEAATAWVAVRRATCADPEDLAGLAGHRCRTVVPSAERGRIETDHTTAAAGAEVVEITLFELDRKVDVLATARNLLRAPLTADAG